MSDLPPQFRLSRVLLVSLGIGTAITCLSIARVYDGSPPVVVAGCPVPFVSWDTTPGAALDVGVYALPLAYDVLTWTGPCFIVACLGVTARIRLRRVERGNGGEARTCVRCRYDLTGNVSGICPECGTPVCMSRRRRSRLPLKWLGFAGLTVVVLGAVWIEVETGSHGAVCDRCAARSSVCDISVFGWYAEYGRRIQEGAISKAVQAFDGVPCRHTWEYAHGGCYLLFLRRGDGVGPGLCLYGEVAGFERSHPALGRFLSDKMAEDPSFGPALKRAIQGGPAPGHHEFNEFIFDLIGEITAFEAATPTTAAAPP
jgi:hypothetical protein